MSNETETDVEEIAGANTDTEDNAGAGETEQSTDAATDEESVSDEIPDAQARIARKAARRAERKLPVHDSED